MTLHRRAFLSLAAAAAALLPQSSTAQTVLKPGSGGIGRVDALSGVAFRRRPEGLLVLKAGDPVFADDELVTAEDSRLQVRLHDGGLLVLGAGSRCALNALELPSDSLPGRGLATMSGGILRVILQGGGRWQGFAVRGSTAVASVRGTDFVVESQAADTAVFVVHGLVAVEGLAGGSVRLSAGEGTDVAAGERPTEARQWPPERVQRTLQQVQVQP